MISLDGYSYIDIEGLKMRFKALLDPDFSETTNDENKSLYLEEFTKICNYLSQEGYLINGTNPNNFDYNHFANTDIKTLARQTYGSEENGSVK